MSDIATSQMRDVIQGILSPDNDVRRGAETIYDKMQEDPSLFFAALTRVLLEAEHLHMRTFAVVILRQQLLPAKKLWNQVNDETKHFVQTSLFNLFLNESNTYIREKVIDALAMLASRLFKEAEQNNLPDLTQAWPEIIQLIITVTGDNNADLILRIGCFAIMEKIAEFCVLAFVPQIHPIFERVMACINPQNLQLANASCRAAMSILVSASLLVAQPVNPDTKTEIAIGNNILNGFTPLIEPILGILAAALQQEQESVISDLLEHLQSITKIVPNAFKSNIAPVVAMIEQIVANSNIEPCIRNSAVTFLLSLSKTAAGRTIVRSEPAYARSLITMAFNFIMNVQHEAAWESREDFDDEELNPDIPTGVYIIQSLPYALGAGKFVPMVFPEIFTLARSPNWQQQYAAMTVFATLIEECPKHFSKKLDPVVDLFKQVLGQPQVHPRVKVASFNAIINLAENLSPKLAISLLPTISPNIDLSTNCLNVVSVGIFCIANVIGACRPVKLSEYAPGIISSALNLLNCSFTNVKLNSLMVISAIALVLREKFSPYTPEILPGLVNLVAQTNSLGPCNSFSQESNNIRNLRSKAIECISVICVAIGKEAFLPHADNVVQTISQAQSLETQSETPSLDLIFKAYERISECLGPDFGPYLVYIIPYMLKTAQTDNFSYYFDVDEDGKMSPSDEIKASALTPDLGFSCLTINIRGSGNKKLYLNTIAVQDKIVACEMLGHLAVSLREEYSPFVNATAEVLLPMCTYTVNPRVRTAAVTSIPALLDSAKSSAPDQATLMAFWVRCLNALSLDTWVEKELPSGLSPLLLSTASCLDVIGTHLPDEHIEHIAHAVVVALDICYERRRSMEQTVTNEADEEAVEDFADAMKVENDALDSIAALISSLSKVASTRLFLTIFETKILQRINLLLELGQKDPYSYLTGYVVYANIIAEFDDGTGTYIPSFLPRFIQHIEEPVDHELRRACAFGVVTCVRKLKKNFEPYFVEVFTKALRAMAIQYEDDDDEERCESASDNVISLVCELINLFPEKIGDEQIRQIIPKIVDVCPRIFDDEESTVTHKYLASWYKSDSSLIFGSQNQAFARGIIVTGEIIKFSEDYPDIVDTSDLEIFKNMWIGIKSQIAPEQLDQLFKDPLFKEAVEYLEK